jgi:glycosyltransferase involved in cell wall biosynthesis
VNVAPIISVLMPVWNGAEYLREAIEGILNQTFSNFEFIVVDDGSTDGTSGILSSYKDPRLKVFRREHAGIVSALNFGAAQVQGNWIARQDADDVSHPNRLELQWLSVKKRPDVALCHTNFQVLDGQIVRPAPARFPRSKALVGLKLCFQCPITHGTVMFRKNAFHLAGGYREGERHAEDYSLWTAMIEQGEFVGIPNALVTLRVHQQSASRQNQETQLRLAKEIGIRHCQRILQADPDKARRAYEVLNALPRDRKLREWVWFVARCLPGLRWKSAELYAWLASQTFRTLFGKTMPKREGGRA